LTLLHGRDGMNRMLEESVVEFRPDLLFCFLFTEELKKETIAAITKKTKTLNWFADDHWRFPVFSKYWAPLFTAVATTDSRAAEKYKKIGVKNVIHTQWGANSRLYYPQAQEKQYNITFVGLNYSKRQQYIDFLSKTGLPVEAFGTLWPAGQIPKEQTAKIWSNSKINLNFTESYAYGGKFLLKSLAKLFIKKELGKYRLDTRHFFDNVQSATSMKVRQIKSRTFEIPACGGFLLTGDADNLRDYYIDGKEIVIFKNKDDLAEKCKYYLEHEQQRRDIAAAGYARTIKDHVYERRFSDIFRAMDLL
jgi:spore maturation protein CgeB